MKTEALATSTKSEKLRNWVVPVIDSVSDGNSAIPPTVNITISHGPQMLANSARVLKPKTATSTATRLKPTAMSTKTKLVG